MQTNMKPLLFYGHCSIALVVFSGCVYSDVSDIDRQFLAEGGYIYPAPPVLLDEPPPLYLPPSPLPPVFSDEVPQPPNYIPPSPQAPYLPPINEVYPPQLPPIISNDDSVVVPAPPPQAASPYPPSRSLMPPQILIQNMSCTQGSNFRATFKLANDLPQFPVVDDATEGCISPINGNLFRIDLESFNGMLKCGVRRCRGGGKNQENMCVVIRLPTVRGVRLPEDGMVTLMCTPQERVVIQTRHVKLGSNKIQQTSRGRSNTGFVATGGTQKDLKTRIGIFRKRAGSNVFDQNVLADSVIQLGEELALRALINEEDGWKGSQVGPVLITGLNSKKSALLLNQQGCVNPAMKSICPKQPFKVNPLGTELHFRAFLFQESPQGDDMVVSVRTQGCLHLQDCVRSDSCLDDATTRSKRDLANNSNNKNVTKALENSIIEEIKNWESQLSFKVGPVIKTEKVANDDDYFDRENLTILCISFIVMVLLSIFFVILFLSLRLNRHV